MKKSFNKKAVMSVLAITLGATSSASAFDFSLKEITNQPMLIAHDRGGKGIDKEGTKTKVKSTKSKSDSKKESAKNETTAKAKGAEASCAEGKCGEGKCGEGKCGSHKN